MQAEQIDSFKVLQDAYLAWLRSSKQDEHKKLDCTLNFIALSVIFKRAFTVYPNTCCIPDPWVHMERMYVINCSEEIQKNFFDYFPRYSDNRKEDIRSMNYSEDRFNICKIKFYSTEEEAWEHIESIENKYKGQKRPKYFIFC